MNREKLIRSGIDYDDGVHRFAEKPEIYEKYLLKFFTKNEFFSLKQMLKDGDFESAFRMAHNLKSNAGDLSITAFYAKICQMVSALRAGVQDESLMTMYAEAETIYKATREAIEGELNERSN